MKYIKSTPGENIFSKNPEFRAFKEIQRLINTFGEERTSTYFWCVWIMEDIESPMYTFLEEEKRENLLETYLVEEPNFDFSVLDELRKVFPDITMTPAKKNYYLAQKEFENFMEEMPNQKNKHVQLAKINDINKGLESLKQSFEKELGAREETFGKESSGIFN